MIAETKTTRVDIRQGAAHLMLRAPLATMDNMAHVFEAQVYDGDAAADLSGAKCEAYFIRADGVTVMLDGTVSGSTASVTLGANCYAVPGRFELAVKLTQGDTVHTILRAEGSVTTSRTDAMTGAGSGVHSFDQLEETLDGLNTAVQQRSRVWNLLDNSDFRNPVNQRGASSVTANWGYIIDRLATPAASEATPITVSADGVTLSNAKGTSTMSLRQLIANVPNGTYTAAADINGTVCLRVFTLTDGTISHASGAGSPEGQVYPDFRDSMLRFYVQAFAGYDVTCKWAALYEGEYTAETLPAYVPKGYAAELMECQRYFWRCRNTYHAEGIGYAYSNTQFRGYIVTPQTLKSDNLTMAAATGDTTSYGIKVCLNSGKSVAPTAATIRSTPNRIMITLTGSFTSGELGVLRIESDYLDFSADL